MEKNKSDRENLVRKYFIKTPTKPKYFWNFFWMAISILLIIGGLAIKKPYRHNTSDNSLILIISGILVFLISIGSFLSKRGRYLTAYHLAEPKASDEQMDQWLTDGKDSVIKAAMERLDIDHEDTSRDPLIIDGPANQTNIAPGKDKIFRFRTHNLLLFFLTEHNVSTFQCLYDLGIGEILEDKTKEFPYKDITNLETITTTDTFYYKNEKKAKFDGLKSFSLFTSGGNSISINYSFMKNVDGDEFRFPPTDDENTIKAIRKRLKEYKDKYSSGLQNMV